MTTVSKPITIVPYRVYVERLPMTTPWQMTMGDDDQYFGNGDNILECVAFGHYGQEEANHGKMWFRISPTHAIEITFKVEEIS